MKVENKMEKNEHLIMYFTRKGKVIKPPEAKHKILYLVFIIFVGKMGCKSFKPAWYPF